VICFLNDQLTGCCVIQVHVSICSDVLPSNLDLDIWRGFVIAFCGHIW